MSVCKELSSKTFRRAYPLHPISPIAIIDFKLSMESIALITRFKIHTNYRL